VVWMLRSCRHKRLRDILKIRKGAREAVEESSGFKAEIKIPVQANAEPSKPSGKESLVYSGVSAGLPGTFKKAFSDDNFDLLFEGKNLIERLTDDEAGSILDLNITRLLKTEAKQLSSNLRRLMKLYSLLENWQN